MLISPEYRSLNQTLHNIRPTYGAGGYRWADTLRGLYDCGTVLDYGSGKGTLKQTLPEIPILEYDPAFPDKQKCPPCRWVICTDVLEHIEPECLDEVLEHIATRMLHRGLLVAATRLASKSLPDGRNAHLIVESSEWWEAKVREFFDVQSMAKNLSQGEEVTFVVGPKEGHLDD